MEVQNLTMQKTGRRLPPGLDADLKIAQTSYVDPVSEVLQYSDLSSKDTDLGCGSDERALRGA